MVSESRIKSDIETLSRAPRNSRENPGHHAFAAQWIAREFESIGLAVSRQVFDIPDQSPDRTGVNIIGSLNEGSGESPIVIGSHYDTVPNSPGADDNASGVAAMLECARTLIESGSSRHITFVAFDAEELQHPAQGLHGSTAYVGAMTESNRPSATIILESVGFSSSIIKQQLPGSFRFLFRRAYNALKLQKFEANSLLILSKGQGRNISRSLERSAQDASIQLPILPLEVPWWMPLIRNLRRSDHAPFWQADIPAVMISDTANFRNPHYHQTSDTAETVDVDLVTRAARMILNTIDRGDI